MAGCWRRRYNCLLFLDGRAGSEGGGGGGWVTDGDEAIKGSGKKWTTLLSTCIGFSSKVKSTYHWKAPWGARQRIGPQPTMAWYRHGGLVVKASAS